MPDEPNGNGSATHDSTAVAPPPPFLEDDDDFSEDLLDPLPDDDDDEPGAQPFALDMSVPDEEDFDLDFDDDDDVDVDVDHDVVAPVVADDERIAKLEVAAASLAAADMDRHNRRVRRKVSAATTGAGATGLVPVLLSLVGVYDLDPALTAALSTAASLVGAFVVGYFTPERRPSLDPALAHEIQTLGG